MTPALKKLRALLLLTSLLLSSCGSTSSSGDDLIVGIDNLQPRTSPADQPLRIVTSNSIIADVATQIGGGLIDVESLLPPGSDPHELDLAPADLQRIERADLVLISGFGLETSLLDTIGASGLDVAIVSVSQDLQPLILDPAEHEEEHEEEHVEEHEHEGGGADPHVWLDPLNVVQWAGNIAAALGKIDPDQSNSYQENAADYIRELHELDRWIAGTLEPLPASERLLVSDHASLGYFAERYDFRVLGAVIPSFSTLAEPAPQELAELARLIEEHRVAALFVDAGSNLSAMAGLSDDLGIPIVVLYEGSLSGPSGPAENYLQMMRYNAMTIRAALVTGADG